MPKIVGSVEFVGSIKDTSKNPARRETDTGIIGIFLGGGAGDGDTINGSVGLKLSKLFGAFVVTTYLPLGARTSV